VIQPEAGRRRVSPPATLTAIRAALSPLWRFGIWAFPLVQVGLITAAAGWCCIAWHATCWDPRLAAFAACSFYAPA